MKSLVAVLLFLSVVNLISGDTTAAVPQNNGASTTVITPSSSGMPITIPQATTRGYTGNITASNETKAPTIPHNNTADNNTLSTTTTMKIPITTKSSISGKPELSSPTASKSHSTVTQTTSKSTTQLTRELYSSHSTTMKTLSIKVNLSNSGNDVKERPPSYQKGLFIGVGCVVAVIICVVLVFLYKICKKKPPEAENAATKVSAQEKESVKLLSVKTSAADSDAKRTALPHTEYIIEC